MAFYVYMLHCRDKSYYVGHVNASYHIRKAGAFKERVNGAFAEK